MLDLWRLQLMRELSMLGTITRVAAAKNITRPAVSQQLALLEREVGATLFERSGRGIRLTAAGRKLVGRIEELMGIVDEIESDFAVESGIVAGVVKVAAFGTSASGLVPVAMRRLRDSHPMLTMDFLEMEPDEGLRATAAKQVDLAIVDELVDVGSISAALDIRPLYVDHYVAVVSNRHRLAARRSVALRDLKDDRWGINHAASGFHSFLVAACLGAGFTPKVVVSCRNTAATLEFVRADCVVTVLPSLGLRYLARDKGLRALPLKPSPERRIFTATPRGMASRPAIAAVIGALERAVPAEAGAGAQADPRRPNARRASASTASPGADGERPGRPARRSLVDAGPVRLADEQDAHGADRGRGDDVPGHALRAVGPAHQPGGDEGRRRARDDAGELVGDR